MKIPASVLLACLLLASSGHPAPATGDTPSARWNPQTIDWQKNPNLVIGDWRFDRPGYPPGLYIEGVTVKEGELVANPGNCSAKNCLIASHQRLSAGSLLAAPLELSLPASQWVKA
jgi:hypothetical protein